MHTMDSARMLGTKNSPLYSSWARLLRTFISITEKMRGSTTKKGNSQAIYLRVLTMPLLNMVLVNMLA